MPEFNDKIKPPFVRRKLGERILLLIICLLFFLFFSNDFGLIDIQKTAIILAAGVDKEADEFIVSAQIAVPQDSESGKSTNEVTVTGKGKTIAQAFREINVKTGWFPKLVFCDLVVLGEDVVKENVFAPLSYFLRNEYMSDNCLLATCEGKASELFSATIPTEEMTAMGLQKVLSTEAKEAGNISTVNLKDFAVGYYSDFQSGFMPYIRKSPQPEGEDTGAGSDAEKGKSQSQSAASTSKEGEGKSGEENESMFDASQTALFYQGKMVGLLTSEQSFAYNLISNNVRLATMEVPYDGNVYALGLKETHGRICFKMDDNNTPILKVNFSAKAQTSDVSTPEDIQEITQFLSVKQEVLEEAQKMLEQNILVLFEESQKTGCDLFRLQDKLRKTGHPLYDQLKDEILTQTTPEITVKIEDLA